MYAYCIYCCATLFFLYCVGLHVGVVCSRSERFDRCVCVLCYFYMFSMLFVVHIGFLFLLFLWLDVFFGFLWQPCLLCTWDRLLIDLNWIDWWWCWLVVTIVVYCYYCSTVVFDNNKKQERSSLFILLFHKLFRLVQRVVAEGKKRLPRAELCGTYVEWWLYKTQNKTTKTNISPPTPSLIAVVIMNKHEVGGPCLIYF